MFLSIWTSLTNWAEIVIRVHIGKIRLDAPNRMTSQTKQNGFLNNNQDFTCDVVM